MFAKIINAPPSQSVKIQDSNMAFPIFYRICFTIFDIFLPIFGVFGNLIAPTFILNNYTSLYVSPPATETILLLDAMAGFLASLAFMQIYFLSTRPNDMTVWRGMQGGTLLVDIFMLGGFARALITEGRTDCMDWRSDDWSNVGGYVVIAAIRLAFLLGVGIRGEGKGKRA